MADHHQIVAEIRARLALGRPRRGTAGSPGWRRPTPRPASRSRSGWDGVTGCCSRGCDPRRFQARRDGAEAAEHGGGARFFPSGLSGTTLVADEPANARDRSCRSSRRGCCLTEAYSEEDPLQGPAPAGIAGWPCKRAPAPGSRIGVFASARGSRPGANPIWARRRPKRSKGRSNPSRSRTRPTEAVRHHDPDAIAGLGGGGRAAGLGRAAAGRRLVQSLRKAPTRS